MRHVVTFDMPIALHTWLKQEAARQTGVKRKEVGFGAVVVQAIEKYKAFIETSPPDWVPSSPPLDPEDTPVKPRRKEGKLCL